MFAKGNIPWRSKTFLSLRILELISAVVVLVVIIPRDRHYHGITLNKRAPIPEPRGGGGGHSGYSSSGSTSSSGGAGDATQARYATPYVAFADAILTIIWCIIAIAMYCCCSLRPKVSMFWDEVLMVLWLGLIICNSIGMYETQAWTYGPERMPAQYSVFIISCIVFFMLIWSRIISGKAHREFGPGNPVPGDLGQTAMETLPTHTRRTANPQQVGISQPYNAGQQQQYAQGRYSQGYPPQSIQYQPPVWRNSQSP